MTQPEGSKLISTAETSVDKLIDAARWQAWKNRAFAVVCIVLLVFGGIGAWNIHRVSAIENQLRSGAITNCLAGNKARMTNEASWDEFITILIDNPQTTKTRTQLLSEIQGMNLPADITGGLDAIVIANWTNNPNDVKLAHQFENYIAAHEAQVNCAASYGDPK